MPIFQEPVQVPQGNVNTSLAQESIGTDGCATCVGVIVVDNRNFKTCGHFDCGIPDNGDMNAVRIAAARILAIRFPTDANTVRVGYCTTSNGNSTTAIIAAITNRYPAPKIVLASRARAGIRARLNGNLRLLQWNDGFAKQPVIDNHLAEIR
jgi:hypothetical protein